MHIKWIWELRGNTVTHPRFMYVAVNAASKCKSGIRLIARTQLRHVLEQHISHIKHAIKGSPLDAGRRQENGHNSDREIKLEVARSPNTRPKPALNARNALPCTYTRRLFRTACKPPRANINHGNPCHYTGNEASDS